MKSVTSLMRGFYRGAMRLDCKTVVPGRVQGNIDMETRGWKMFLLLPRMMLYRPPRGGLVPRHKFISGEWSLLVVESLIVAASGEVSSRCRRRRQQSDDIERCAKRAWSLVQMGELSAGRHVLEAVVVAPGIQRTLDMLQDTSRRPRQPRAAVPGHIAQLQPDNLLDLDQFKFRECIHSARRGAAAGPSGMTAEHLKLMLESGVDIQHLDVASGFARGEVLPEVVGAFGMGHMTALQKDDGGVRGIVVGRRLSEGGRAPLPSNSASSARQPRLRSSSPFRPGLVASA